MEQRELQARLQERFGEDWLDVWQDVREHRLACLRAIQDAVGLYREPAISSVRLRLELDCVVRLIAEKGP